MGNRYNRKHLGCSIEGCDGKHYGRSLCRKHWRRATGEGKRRYQVVKNNKELKRKALEANKRWKQENPEVYKKSKQKSDKKYYEKNKEAVLAYRAAHRELERFGRSREEILKLFDNRCQICHKEEDLVIHHIDNKGRAVKNPNNDLENFTVLCRACHMIHHLHVTLL